MLACTYVKHGIWEMYHDAGCGSVDFGGSRIWFVGRCVKVSLLCVCLLQCIVVIIRRKDYKRFEE